MPDPDLHRAHVGRVPHLQLPAVGGGVLRVRVHRRPVARLPPRSTSSTPSSSSSAATAASAPSTTTEHRHARPVRAPSTLRGAGRTTLVSVSLYRDQGVVLRSDQARGDRPHRHHPDARGTARSGRWPRACASRAAGSGPGSSPRATSRSSATGAARPRRRHPGRDHRRQPRAARALRLPHPRGVDARGHRPGRAGARAQPGALPDARRARCARWPSRAHARW